MPRKRSIKPADLPQTPETWAVAPVLLRTWIAPPGEKPYRPTVILIMDLTNDFIMGGNLTPHTPTLDDIYAALVAAMAKPNKGTGRPRRPAVVYCPEPELTIAMSPMLAEIGVQCETHDLSMVADIIKDLETHMRHGEPELPGLLAVRGVTPTLAGGVFAAAAEFYRAAPWVQLANEHTIAIRVPADGGRTRIAVTLGNAGVEYGLAMYDTWADVEKQFMGGVDHPSEAIPAQGQLVMFYDSFHRLSFDDLEAKEQHGWETAGEGACPLPLFVHRSGDARRPDPEELKWLEAALRAIPLFVRDHLRPDGKGDYQPVEAALNVATHSGEAAVHLKYPAGILPREQRPARDDIMDWADDEDEKETDEIPLFDRRMMEGPMAEIGRMMGAERPGDRNLQKAQELMYKAWDEPNPAKRLALAHEAVATSDKCADGYVLLAEEQADTVARALEYYQRGMEAGERALDPEYFKEALGHFWGILETRPYMRARQGVADCLIKLNRFDEAIAHFREMLRLNPGDNQGIRYILLSVFVDLDRNDEALGLLKQYDDDAMADWLYTWALVEFRLNGPGKDADRKLKNAFKWNPHVPAYLTGRKRVPNRLPPYISPGKDDEAAHYANNYLNHWRRTPGAVAWLMSKLPKR